jgi:hypothetical protein
MPIDISVNTTSINLNLEQKIEEILGDLSSKFVSYNDRRLVRIKPGVDN